MSRAWLYVAGACFVMAILTSTSTIHHFDDPTAWTAGGLLAYVIGQLIPGPTGS